MKGSLTWKGNNAGWYLAEREVKGRTEATDDPKERAKKKREREEKRREEEEDGAYFKVGKRVWMCSGCGVATHGSIEERKPG